MREIIQVRLSGFGGQGIVLAGLLLGEAAVLDGRYVAGSNSYGAQARGSGCKSEIILSDSAIDFPHITSADILMVMSQGAFTEYGREVNPGGVIVYDDSQVNPGQDRGAHLAGIGATGYAVKVLKNKQAANMVLLGALVELTHVVSRKAMVKSIEKHVAPRFRSRNMEAFAAGAELLKEQQERGKRVASAGHRDVEASRHPQAAGARGTRQPEETGTYKPVVRQEACGSCKVCAEGCPAEVIAEYRREADSLRGVLYSSQAAKLRHTEKRGLPPCRQACPVDLGTDTYVQLITQGKFLDALDAIRKVLPFPGIMGCICHHPCEDACLRKAVDEPVSLCRLKGFLADYEAERREPVVPAPPQEKEGRVAVVGGGPSGMACAIDLRRAGYKVTLFEAHDRLGGMLYYGVPVYRLPREVLEREFSLVEKTGIEVRYHTTVGRDISLRELYETYDALFIGCGAQASLSLPLDHVDRPGVVGGIEFLKRVNENAPAPVGTRVVVTGGGNVAIDCAITARRLGAKEVRIVCLEKKGEMAAAAREVAQAREEGVKVLNGWAPRSITVDKNGRVTGMALKRCLSVFDRSGQLNPTYDERATRQVEADMVLLAIGQAARLDFLESVEGIALTPSGWIKADPGVLETTVPGIFAGGDAVTGPRTAIEAVADGKKAASAIAHYLSRREAGSRKEAGRNRRRG